MCAAGVGQPSALRLFSSCSRLRSPDDPPSPLHLQPPRPRHTLTQTHGTPSPCFWMRHPCCESAPSAMRAGGWGRTVWCGPVSWCETFASHAIGWCPRYTAGTQPCPKAAPAALHMLELWGQGARRRQSRAAQGPWAGSRRRGTSKGAFAPHAGRLCSQLEARDPLLTRVYHGALFPHPVPCPPVRQGCGRQGPCAAGKGHAKRTAGFRPHV